MAELLGYNGKVAHIDLSANNIKIKDLELEYAEKYIGGVNLSAKLTYDMLSDKDYEVLKDDPLAPVNPLIFATGPLTGTAVPSSSRYSLTGISPLTGIWGESTSGGFFPVALKKCGYDAIVITGDAPEPVYILIRNAKIEIKPAANLWGKNTRETIELIRKENDDKNLRIACIGIAGEKLVRFAAVINDDGRAAGRCGLGALMGKKKLKALAVRSTEKIAYKDKKALVDLAMKTNQNIEGNFSYQFFSHYGTLCYMDMGMVLGDVPAKYFTSSEFVAEDLTGMSLRKQYPVIKYGCAGCRIGCGRKTIITINDEEVGVDGPEYETTAAFGPLCGVSRFQPIIKANHLCNLDGIDTISCGVVIAFLIFLVENQIEIKRIKSKLGDVKLKDIKWGNADIILELIKKTSNREGIGNLLAEGVKRMAEELNVDPELAAHVKGLEIPMHDPRAYAGQALTYMTACIGASHEKGDFFNIDGDAAIFPGVKKGNRFDINKREKSVKILQDIAAIFDSAVICNFPHVTHPVLAQMMKAATGLDNLGKYKRLLKAGERGTNVKRLISCKLGITAKDDKLPKIVLKTLETGGSAHVQLNLENNLKTYYDKRGWDENGIPKPETLRKLDI
ncbi:MAG: aldehyde ferredoxin oxidoreductase family protein [Promethearchaeota archaeon]